MLLISDEIECDGFVFVFVFVFVIRYIIEKRKVTRKAIVIYIFKIACSFHIII